MSLENIQIKNKQSYFLNIKYTQKKFKLIFKLKMAAAILDTSSITIDKIIVHSIPRHKKDDFTLEPQYSEQESSLPDDLRLFFKDKVIQSLGSNKELRVCYDSDSVSPVSTYINQIINSDGEDLIEQSKK